MFAQKNAVLEGTRMDTNAIEGAQARTNSMAT